jgi:hypothetical protein
VAIDSYDYVKEDEIIQYMIIMIITSMAIANKYFHAIAMTPSAAAI